jgi:hypothetical protein
MTTVSNGHKTIVDAGQVTNGAQDLIEQGFPYRMAVTVIGTAPLLFHAWNSEAVDEKAKSAKGSKAKKTDDIESYVYRNYDGYLGVPGANFAASICLAGKFMQDPRSPRKSALDLCKAGIVPLSIIAPFEPMTKDWDYEDRRRVTIQRAGITRTRPAMREGWRVTFDLLINLSEYLNPAIMTKLINDAGRLVGVCDFRPTYGRFSIQAIEYLEP